MLCVLSMLGSVVLVGALVGGIPSSPAGDRAMVAVVRDGDQLRTVAVAVPQGLRGAEAGAHVRSLPGVVAVGVDVPVTVETVDPLSEQQWPVQRLRLPRAWDAVDGSGQVIAIVDSGIDATHPDLAGAMRAGWDALTGGDGATDPYGHGTAVAGLAAAIVGNGVGIGGVGGGAQLMPVRVLDDEGRGNASDVAAGIIWAADHGASVINVSLSTTHTELIDDAVGYATAAGVVVVAAAGNAYAQGNPQLYPAADERVLAVTAVDPYDRRAVYANTGSHLDLAAPGVSVLSSVTGGGYDNFGGTSMAAPHVAGLAALVRARWPGLTVEEVGARLRETAVDLGDVGFDPLYGAGLVDPVAALDAPAAATTVEQIGGTDPVGIGIAVSQAVFAEGEADRAVLARSDAFADTLAGAPLAGSAGPLLFTAAGSTASLDPATAHELARAVRPGGTVFLLGGEDALSSSVASAVAEQGFAVVRLAGASRIETALEIARHVNPDPDRVLLARADDWADAVTGGAYAAATGLPVLLTGSDALHPSVASYLAEHNAAVVLLGGPSALSGAVEDAAGPGAVRVWGDSRAATAVAVARDLWPAVAAAAPSELVLVDGFAPDSWAAALAGGVLSAARGGPQLLVGGGETAGLPSVTADHVTAMLEGRTVDTGIVLVGGGITAETVSAITDLAEAR